MDAADPSLGAGMPAPSRLDDLRGWFEQHASVLYCWLRARVKPSLRADFDAEDLLQEVWLRAVRVLPDTSVANPRAWLLSIAGYVFLEAMRGWQRRARLLAVSADGSHVDVTDEVTTMTRRVARDELRQRFFASLDHLDDDDRQLLLQHGLEGRSLAQVAERLGISTEAAYKRWQRLRAHLVQLGSPADLL